MRIALIMETAPTDGGAFQQAMSTVELLVRNNHTRHEFVVFTPIEATRQALALHYGIAATKFTNRIIRHVDFLSSTWLGGTMFRRLRRLGFRRLGRHLDAFLDDHGIDLVFFTDMFETSMRLSEHLFITTIMDLDHVDHPEYPEYFRSREFQNQERILRDILPRSLAVIVNTSSEADRIALRYDVEPKRIICMPFVPSYSVRRYAAMPGKADAGVVEAKYDLPKHYVFYPAYFLAHKNHLYLLEAMVELQQRFAIEVHAVFCGADPNGEKALLERQVSDLGLTERVHFLGYVPDEDIPVLYEGAFAVVCPSPFGPTNLQPIAAVTMGKPVICVDVVGCHEQMGDAALYCDLADPASLAVQLESLIRNPELVARLQNAGYALAQSLENMNYSERLAKCLDNYDYIRRRWCGKVLTKR